MEIGHIGALFLANGSNLLHRKSDEFSLRASADNFMLGTPARETAHLLAGLEHDILDGPLKVGTEGPPGHIASDFVPIIDVGSSSQRSSSALVVRAAIADSSGPLEVPLPRTMWQPEHPPAP